MRPRPQLLRAYVTAVTVAAIVLLAQAQYALPADPSGFWNTIGVLVGLALVSEAAALRIPRTTVVTSVAFLPMLAAVLMVGPAWAMVVAACTGLFVEAVMRRKPLIKIAHNTGRAVVAVGVAAYLYGLAGGTVSFRELDPRNMPAFVAAAVTYIVIVNGATATAVSLSTGEDLAESWAQLVGKGLVEDLLSSSIAVLLVYLYTQLQLFGLLLIIVPLFLARHALHRNLQLEEVSRELLELMVKAIEARDPYTSGHSLRVATYSKMLARELGLVTRDIEQIETAALLHDVGKIYQEFAPVLRKEGKLTPDERILMQSHPIKSAELVGTISSLRGYVQQCVRSHHENYDGGGYPDGLEGSEIPIGARIIMVADTADAMMTDRPYRNALTFDDVVEELARLGGAQFDPSVVRAFNRCSAIRALVEERGPTEHPGIPEPSERIRELAERHQARLPRWLGRLGSTTPTRAR